MMRKTLSAALLALVALGSTACSDGAAPTAPAAPGAVTALSAAAAKPRSKVPYISDLQLSSIYLSISGSSTPFTITVTNPTRKDFPSIYVKGELKSDNNQPPTPATAFLAHCPYANGIVPPGDCTMSDGITGGAGLVPGPAVFTIRVLQQQSDGTMKVLDSRTVDVILSQF